MEIMSERADKPVAMGQPGGTVTPGLRRLLFFAIAVFIAHQVLYLGIYKPLTIFGVDYGKHWKAARAVLEGRSTYLEPELWMGFNYPQATAFTFIWLGWMSFETAQKVWKIFLLACIVACWAMAWRALKPAAPDSMTDSRLAPGDRLLRGAFRAHWWLATAFATAAFMPAVSAIYIGNIDPYNALLAVAMVALLAKERPRAAGVVWALLTLVKLLPGALLIPVLLWRRGRVLAAFLATMLVYLLILIAMNRLQFEWYFFREMLPKVPSYWRNISITPIRILFDATGHGDLWNNPYAFETAARIQLALFAAAYCAVLFNLKRRGLDWMRGLEVAIVLYPILTPLLEYHHFVFMLPALYLQARRWAEGRMGWGVAGGLLAGWVMLQIGFIIGFQFSNIGEHSQYFSTLAYFAIMAFTLTDAFSRKKN